VLGVLKPAILETDVHLSQLPQSLAEMRLINTKRPLMPEWLSAMRGNLEQMNNVTPSPTEHLSTTTYLDFTGFNQKCFISRTMQVRGCYVPGRAESRNAQRRHAFATLRLTSNFGEGSSDAKGMVDYR
jgi:hypothetical protein